ncbi:hypothetical protein LEP1GSC161_3201 [Leptospira santarosai str. CBC1416]|uniref:Uncharacterized protein n=1 Tax=Leptospira santarosai str. CBC1416 TaxID=1193059 RepID=M6W2I7_9LEPT|nr:hypothetical protein LEP1GSC169_3433 [Leptospira santarosai str. HAI1349]EMO14565.1 hypothetical protein LEP1GSC165_2374 [Leptospira santarosai str. CBC523]EMO20812.1 hypothetical protein LEP1GSC168_4047 [Leptospira santarosai str. HAI134]EMO59444.1 hypothetical protein LEP1GSC161_3201 [Leptospira santarosai str. CBC1416]EMP79331.1 hypothetical protein LEP1GSC162_2525 [Leptospira santarosai str. CBC1531]
MRSGIWDRLRLQRKTIRKIGVVVSENISGPRKISERFSKERILLNPEK